MPAGSSHDRALYLYLRSCTGRASDWGNRGVAGSSSSTWNYLNLEPEKLGAAPSSGGGTWGVRVRGRDLSSPNQGKEAGSDHQDPPPSPGSSPEYVFFPRLGILLNLEQPHARRPGVTWDSLSPSAPTSGAGDPAWSNLEQFSPRPVRPDLRGGGPGLPPAELPRHLFEFSSDPGKEVGVRLPGPTPVSEIK